jgi:DNA-directed RNA polymerase subunit M/transcription elongation factor TFIIS
MQQDSDTACLLELNLSLIEAMEREREIDICQKYVALSRQLLQFDHQADVPAWEQTVMQYLTETTLAQQSSNQATVESLYVEKWQSLLHHLDKFSKDAVDDKKRVAIEMVRWMPWDWDPELFRAERDWEEHEERQERGLPLVTTNQFLCKGCGKRECVYFTAQTRAGDEGMTQYITCIACGKSWKQ